MLLDVHGEIGQVSMSVVLVPFPKADAKENAKETTKENTKENT